MEIDFDKDVNEEDKTRRIRPTTLEAYKKVIESGLLSKLRLTVYEIICTHGPLTANEMRMYASPDVNSGVFSTRLSELERMGIVKTVGTRKCKTSGHSALVWDITNNTPIKLERNKTLKEKKAELLEIIEKLQSNDNEQIAIISDLKNRISEL